MPEELTPPGLRPPVTSHERNDSRKGSLHPAIWTLLGFVAALTLVVLVLLPSLVDKDADVGGRATEIQSRAEVLSTQPAPLPVGVMRSEAEQALKAFLRLRAQPELTNAETWAMEEWKQALNTALKADRLYGEGNFSSALSAYKNATQQLQALLNSKTDKITESLSAGWQALELNQSEQASRAFKRVLAMKNDHSDASAGLAQASVRDEMLQLMKEAQLAEQRNKLEQAAYAYKKATQLDPAYTAAAKAGIRVETLLIESSFEQAMSSALQNLEQGRLKAAHTALHKAAAIHPDSAAVKDIRSRLQGATRQTTLSSYIEKGNQKAAQEDWQAVISLSKKALKLDPRSLSASNKLKYAVAREKLNDQFDHYLADTNRLSSDVPLANAKKLVMANQNIPNEEPELQDKRDRLQEALRLAVIPVEMLIRSDGKTNISVFHIGRFGMFQEKRLTLRPGRYTVTGSCNGYRDVRKVITLKPDNRQYSVEIRCEELI